MADEAGRSSFQVRSQTTVCIERLTETAASSEWYGIPLRTRLNESLRLPALSTVAGVRNEPMVIQMFGGGQGGRQKYCRQIHRHDAQQVRRSLLFITGVGATSDSGKVIAMRMPESLMLIIGVRRPRRFLLKVGMGSPT